MIIKNYNIQENFLKGNALAIYLFLQLIIYGILHYIYLNGQTC
jgi:hypothetical protein